MTQPDRCRLAEHPPAHGRYLGYIRQLKPRQRAEVKALREKKGVEAAIKRAKRLASK